MKLKLFFLVSFFVVWSVHAEHIVFTPRLQMLLDDMKLYKLDAEGEKYLHAGDLYEHSVWTYNAAWEILEDNTLYMQGFSLVQRQKEVVALAALLHDIGKAGRLDLFEQAHPTRHYNILECNDGGIDHIVYFQDYQAHPHIGFEYTGKHFFASDVRGFIPRDYYLLHKQTGQLEKFDFVMLFDELGLTLEEQRLIAILIGIHYEFGNLNHDRISPEQFLEMIEDLVKAVHYNNGELDELIVRLSILIQVIDVKGLTPVTGRKTSLFPEGIFAELIHGDLKFLDPFLALGYATIDQTTPSAVNHMVQVLNAFYQKIQHSNELMESSIQQHIHVFRTWMAKIIGRT